VCLVTLLVFIPVLALLERARRYPSVFCTNGSWWPLISAAKERREAYEKNPEDARKMKI
jgi:hypothetical protein